MKIFILLINFCFVVFFGFTQVESNYPCDNEVSTNPAPGTATNTNLPNNQFVGFNFGEMFLTPSIGFGLLW